MLVTKGDLFHQEMKLAASGLGDRFSSVEIVSEKTAEALSPRVPPLRRRAREAVMAGNSLRSDIWPALEAGAWAAHIPHEFEWAHERADDRRRAAAGLRGSRSLRELAGVGGSGECAGVSARNLTSPLV